MDSNPSTISSIADVVLSSEFDGHGITAVSAQHAGSDYNFQ